MSDRLVGVAYTQSSVYPGTTPADYASMNSGSADGSKQSAACVPAPDAWIQADCGSTQSIDHVVVGYDYLENMPGDWSPANLNGCVLYGSQDGLTFTAITTLPDYDTTGSNNGLVSVPVGGDWRYLRVSANPSQWLGLLEFEVWGSEPSGPPAPPPSPPPDANVIQGEDFLGRGLRNDSSGVAVALDYLGRAVQADNRDFLSRLLIWPKVG